MPARHAVAAKAATAATETLLAAGGPDVAVLEAALKPLQKAIDALTTKVDDEAKARADDMQQLRQEMRGIASVSAKSYNRGCGDGTVSAWVPVPNAAGVSAPPGQAPLANLAELRALSLQTLRLWCAHYGITCPSRMQLMEGRVLLAAQLCVLVPPETLLP